MRVEANHVEANLNIGFISIRFRDYADRREVVRDRPEGPAPGQEHRGAPRLGVRAARPRRSSRRPRRSYNKALKLNASDPRPLYNLGVLYQDHISTQDNVDTAQNEKLINVAKGHYNKFIEAAESNKKWSQQTVLAGEGPHRHHRPRPSRSTKISAELMKKAKEHGSDCEEQDEEERKRLLELEKQAEAAEAAG